MNVNYSQIADYLYGNRVAIGLGFMTALTAAVKTAPAPRDHTGYAWLYDFTHQLLNITNTRPKDAVTIPKP
jgi:hypothetical protein